MKIRFARRKAQEEEALRKKATLNNSNNSCAAGVGRQGGAREGDDHGQYDKTDKQVMLCEDVMPMRSLDKEDELGEHGENTSRFAPEMWLGAGPSPRRVGAEAEAWTAVAAGAAVAAGIHTATSMSWVDDWLQEQEQVVISMTATATPVADPFTRSNDVTCGYLLL